MPPDIIRAQLHPLRLNAIYTAYRGCVEALSKSSIHGGTPSPDLLQKGVSALHELTAQTNAIALGSTDAH